MGFSLYLAMTAAEIAGCAVLPSKLAYMACHFSPYSTGLSNFPETLPEGSLLILNDRTEVCGHDPELVAQQLQQTVDALACCGVLLDLQKPGNPETMQVVQAVIRALGDRVIVSEPYAKGSDCAVLLPPPPLRMPLKEHLAPWQGRPIWLEAAPDAETITVTPEGSSYAPLPLFCVPPDSLTDDSLFCRYQVCPQPDKAVFHIERSGPLLDALLLAAQQLGVYGAVGLYQLLSE